MNNLFEKALASQEVEKFFLGEDGYFIEDVSGYIEPQCVSVALRAHLIPYTEINPEAWGVVEKKLIQLLSLPNDKNKTLYVVMDWIFYCQEYFLECMARGKINGPLIDLSKLAAMIDFSMKENQSSLSRDFRWAGGSWNSDAGLWVPMNRSIDKIKSRLL